MSKGVLCEYYFLQIQVHHNIACDFKIEYPVGPGNEIIH